MSKWQLDILHKVHWTHGSGKHLQSERQVSMTLSRAGKTHCSCKKLHCWHQKKEKKLIFTVGQAFLSLRHSRFVCNSNAHGTLGRKEVQTNAEREFYVEFFLSCLKYKFYFITSKTEFFMCHYVFKGVHVLSCCGFLGGTSSKESACQCRRRKRQRFSSWVGEDPLEEEMATIPVFLPGESHGQRSLSGL